VDLYPWFSPIDRQPWLANRKRAANQTIQSPALRPDIAESATCAYLAAVTLIGAAV